jgi:hypothetical protein
LYNADCICNLHCTIKGVRYTANQSAVELIQGDMVAQNVDAIVNAANSAELKAYERAAQEL